MGGSRCGSFQKNSAILLSFSCLTIIVCDGLLSPCPRASQP
jgi:hypothetical protein